MVMGEFDQPFDELGAVTVVFRATVQVENQRVGLEAGLERGPEYFQGINHKISGDLALGKKEKGFSRGGQEKTK
jgi:hypothetical protein